MEMSLSYTAGQFVGDDLWVSVLDGGPRTYVDLDTAATSSASVAVARAVQEFLPWYASVHRGAGIKSQITSARYEEARETMVRFVGGDPATHLALFPPQHHRGAEPARLPAGSHQGRRRRDHGRRAPRQPAALDAARAAAGGGRRRPRARSTSPPSRPRSTSRPAPGCWP